MNVTLRPLLLLSLLACTHEPSDTKGTSSEDDTDPLAHTDHTPTDTAIPMPNARPLCIEAAGPPVIAPELDAWARSLRESVNKFYGELEWRALEAMGESLGDTAERQVMNRITRGWHRLKFGDLPGAIADFEAAEALADSDVPRWRGRARELLGAAWMRKAETDNCLTHGNGHSCVIPFDEHAIHADPTGMENAAAAFERCLTEDEGQSVSAKWLLNVTYMARGQWPDAVPPQFQFPEGFLDSEGEAAAWSNRAPDLHMTELSLAGGASTEDFDGDGLLDIMFSSFEPEATMRLFLNMGDGWYCNASDASGVSSIPGILHFSAADYDNDGDMDVFAPRGAWMQTQGDVRPSLLRNDGQGHFADVAVEAGMAGADVNGPTQVGAWADVDNDGWLDLYVGREDDEQAVVGRHPSSLYLNQHDGTFVDIAGAAGVASAGFVKGASWFDMDEDGDVDLYVSSLRGRDHLYENRGDLTFVDRAERTRVLEPIKSFPSVAVDYDQDGRLDLFVAAFTNNYGGGGPLDPSYFQSAESYIDDKLGIPADELFSETAHMYRNTGDGFEDVTAQLGLDDIHASMGLSVGDFDMDGWPDIILATGAPEYDALEPNIAYRNDQGQRFLDVTAATRMGHIQKGHGVAFGDLDEDGDEDVVVELGGAFRGDGALNALFVNPTNTSDTTHRHAITLRLEGVRSNRNAIGARVKVVTPGRTFYHLAGQTGSFGGNSMQIEVALADETEIQSVEIRWPSGEVETITEVALDQIHHVREGEGIVDSAPFRRFGVHEASSDPSHDDP
ncbi:MAG TPA: CRTAC1 family protein [Myxococcota bacterium]|nr:CRTAC1 family protein [Myxococcota bacterium]